MLYDKPHGIEYVVHALFGAGWLLQVYCLLLIE